jgi:acetoin utilization protein AcuB
MLSKELISANIPRLQPADTVAKGLRLMDDFHVQQLPVVSNGAYLGLVHEDDLEDAGNDTMPVSGLQEHFSHPLVFEKDHFLKAAQIIREQNLNIVPVLNDDKQFAGVISAADLLRELTGFVGSDTPGGIIVLEVEKRNFSFGELSRLIETHDASITQLNTDEQPETGNLNITIRVNKTEIADIIATLQRFDYNVVYYLGEEAFENEMRSNYDNLMHYLSL